MRMFTEDGFVPDELTEYQEYLDAYPVYFSAVVKELGINASSIKHVFDGDCGYGASTQALADLFDNSEIWAVSKGQTPMEEVKRHIGKKLHFEEKTIMEFLRGTRVAFDLVFFGKVPFTSGIHSSREVELLANRINPKGYVMATTTDLPSDMSSHFKELQFPAGSSAYPLIKVWQKIHNDERLGND